MLAVDIKEHQDAYEFFTRLQDCVDQHMISTGQMPAMQHVLGGRFAQQIICSDVDFRCNIWLLNLSPFDTLALAKHDIVVGYLSYRGV